MAQAHDTHRGRSSLRPDGGVRQISAHPSGVPDGGVRSARRAEGQQDHVPKEEDVLHPQRRLDDRLGGADRACGSMLQTRQWRAMTLSASCDASLAVSAAIEAKSGGGDGGGGGSGEPGEGGERGRPTKVARPEQEGGGQHQRDAYEAEEAPSAACVGWTPPLVEMVPTKSHLSHATSRSVRCEAEPSG